MAKGYIVMIGSAAAAAALTFAKANAETVAERFPKYFLKEGERLEQEETALSAINPDELKAQYCCRIGEKSILKALWNLGLGLDTGMEVDLNKIALCQYTIEICEFAGLNPYEEATGNSLLVVTSEPEILLKKYEAENISVEIIGYLTDGKARIALTTEGVRYLTPER